MNIYRTLLIENSGRTARIILNRPDIHNAFNAELIADLTDAFRELKETDGLRCIVLTGSGPSFCAGADLKWMSGVLDYTYDENFEDSIKLAELMDMIHNYPIPVIARVNGSAIGGGTGLMSVCDIVIAVDTARFAFTEVKLGLVPAVISPYVMCRIGSSRARELFITGERFDAHFAEKIGLINYAVPPDEFDNFVDHKVELILSSGPHAVRAAKELIFDVGKIKHTELMEYTAGMIARLRMSDEAQERMGNFLKKQK